MTKWSPRMHNPAVDFGPAMVTLSGTDLNWYGEGEPSKLTVSIAYAGIEIVRVAKYESPFALIETPSMAMAVTFSHSKLGATPEEWSKFDAEVYDRCVKFHADLLAHMQRPTVMVTR